MLEELFYGLNEDEAPTEEEFQEAYDKLLEDLKDQFKFTTLSFTIGISKSDQFNLFEMESDLTTRKTMFRGDVVDGVYVVSPIVHTDTRSYLSLKVNMEMNHSLAIDFPSDLATYPVLLA